jgi:hypothetical protein
VKAIQNRRVEPDHLSQQPPRDPVRHD